ncbi:MAG TPA: MBL fold metallo-hydrolase [Gemmataceae bacterium]|nr:MBL fold metallo-hydrolase [Gemmataceae bacterium]
MRVHFHVLASGSAGNACLLDADGFGVLIDFGLPPKLLLPRLRKARLSWHRIDAVVLTHTHTDHWKPATLTQFAKLGVPIYCHAEHMHAMDQGRRSFAALSAAGLMRGYQSGQPIELHAHCRCIPIAVDHDEPMTHGFRFDGTSRGREWSVAYASDLGCWQPSLARHFADVDLLALEFNHDVPMQLRSGRHPMLIRRVLGKGGHLSNEQAAALLEEIVAGSTPGRLRHLVQLHLSDDCNHAELAATAAMDVIERAGIDIEIHTTARGRSGPSISLAPIPVRTHVQPMLPFADSLPSPSGRGAGGEG